MVGTSAVFADQRRRPQADCVDQAGEVTGLPDIPFVTTEVVQQCSPITFPIAPPQIICDTKDEHPQTYQASVGRGFYYEKKFGDDLHGAYVFGIGLEVGAQRLVLERARPGPGGLLRVGPRLRRLRARDPDRVRTGRPDAEVQRRRTTRSAPAPYDCTDQAAQGGEDPGRELGRRCGTAARSATTRSLLEEGGADVEGQYVDVLYLPFLDAKDRKANKMAADFVKYTGKDNAGQARRRRTRGQPGIAFRDAVNTIVDENGNNGLTRAACSTRWATSTSSMPTGCSGRSTSVAAR